MLFSSITFLFLFLPIMLAVYYIAPYQWKNLLLLAGSLIFYAWGEPVYIILMILSILLNYFCGMDIENKSENEAKAKRSLVFAITVNIVLLVFFKYFGFLVERIRCSESVFHTGNWHYQSEFLFTHFRKFPILWMYIGVR